MQNEKDDLKQYMIHFISEFLYNRGMEVIQLDFSKEYYSKNERESRFIYEREDINISIREEALKVAEIMVEELFERGFTSIEQIQNKKSEFQKFMKEITQRFENKLKGAGA